MFLGRIGQVGFEDSDKHCDEKAHWETYPSHWAHCQEKLEDFS